MAIHVIILAQGSQRRLPDMAMPKQLLPLVVPDGETGKAIPILVRTLRQIATYTGDLCTTVVCDGALRYFLEHEEVLGVRPMCLTLADPGNSSLKGIARCLDLREMSDPVPLAPNFTATPVERVVVLLGDVVYSWEALSLLFNYIGMQKYDKRFVVSSDLSQSTGEVWGVSWHVDASAPMRRGLVKALANHPPFTDYQPGQMRHWLFNMREPNPVLPGGPDLESFDFALLLPRELDYTMDVDTPRDLPLLDKAAPKAFIDDKDHGLRW